MLRHNPHTLGQCSYSESMEILENYNILREEAIREGIQVAPRELFYVAADGHDAKNHVFGTGAVARKIPKNTQQQSRRASTSNISDIENNEVVNLRKELLEFKAMVEERDNNIVEELKRLRGHHGFQVYAEDYDYSFYNESNNTQTEIWGDSISIKEFTPEQWTAHQVKSIEKVRKSKVSFQIVDSQGNPLPNATVTVASGRPNFPLGCAINSNILNNNAYQAWFFSRFKYTVFENEMKWYSTEPSQGREDYSVSDAMLQLVQNRGVTLRGHNVFWDDPKLLPYWVPNLTPSQLSAAASDRINSFVKRYAGQVIHWDVVNENLHHHFFEEKLGPGASADYYKLTSVLDGKATPFLNDYNTIEHQEDSYSTPSKYLDKIADLRAHGYNGPLGIGLEAHFGVPDLAYVRSAIDTLASTNLPIWITELDVSPRANQGILLEQILNELVSHPAVQGIVIWSAWKPDGCYKMCLTDNNFKNLPTGDVVDGVLKRMSGQGLGGTTTAGGYFETSLFHGDYQVMVEHPSLETPTVNPLAVTPPIAGAGEETQSVINFKVSLPV
ncbi:unnamed protein product [Cuscuta campestris]|uniref:GH10 domain-containing protein n=1 Tax=Cuscuta campestris TaxID=132261 RepID=A0A484NMN5_9ASTE|nr:unnamed protein product [Cuscuta campestris]